MDCGRPSRRILSITMKSKPLLLAALLLAAGILAYAGLTLSTGGTPPTAATSTESLDIATETIGDAGELSLADLRATEFEEETPAAAMETTDRKPALTLAQVMDGLRALDNAPPGAET